MEVVHKNLLEIVSVKMWAENFIRKGILLSTDGCSSSTGHAEIIFWTFLALVAAGYESRGPWVRIECNVEMVSSKEDLWLTTLYFCSDISN